MKRETTARFTMLLAITPLLVACGSDEAGAVHTLTTGSYALSGASLEGEDACGRYATYAAREAIYLDVTGAEVTIDLESPDGTSDPDILQRSTIDGSSLIPVALDPFFWAISGCGIWVRQRISGELTGDDRAALRLEETLTANQPGNPACVGQPFNPTCTWVLHFTATRTGP